MRGLKHRLPETRRGLLVAVFVAVRWFSGAAARQARRDRRPVRFCWGSNPVDLVGKG
jgi:hypothetical protein